MASVTGQMPALAVGPTTVTGGVATFTIGMGLVYDLQAIAFQVNLGSSAQADDIWVEVRAPNGALLVGEIVAASLAAGDTAAFTLAQDLNPCDNIRVSASIGLYPDTFPRLTLAEACQVTIQALKASDGGLDSAAKISEAVLWVTTAGGGDVLTGEPLFVPIPLNEQAA